MPIERGAQHTPTVQQEVPFTKGCKGTSDVDEAVDSVSAWAQRYEHLAVRGVRSGEVANRIALHLLRFERYLRSSNGHDRLSTWSPGT